MPTSSTTTDTRPRLLIVDDEPQNLRLLADIFSDDYQLSLARSGAQALKLLEIARDVELILLDLMMPELDGHQVAEQLRQQPHTRDIPIIFITARHDAENEISALGAGAADYLHKPVHVGLARARVHQQITLARQRRDLTAAREAADAGNRAKSQFLTGISHELRTPLNAILGFSQVLQLDSNLTPEQVASINEIHSAGLHLLTLINDVLDLGKIEASRVELHPKPMDVATLARSCVRLLEPLAQQRKVALQVSVQDGAPTLAWADDTRARQVLVNLLSNAIKFNREGGVVEVILSAADASGALQVSVVDDGPGIERDLQPFIFEPFRRGQAQHQPQVEGTGIGLTICKRLVELMGGAIGFSSVAGHGAHFWFTLPTLAAARGPAENAVEAAPTASTATPQRLEATDAATPAEKAPPRTVLCVDDNPSNLKLLQIVLRRLPGVTVVSTADPREALPLALQHRPDLVLLDILMPEIDGYEVLRRMRAVKPLAEVPVVALSANAMPEDLRRGLEAGFADYFTKPFDVPALLKAVEGFIGRPDEASRN